MPKDLYKTKNVILVEQKFGITQLDQLKSMLQNVVVRNPESICV